MHNDINVFNRDHQIHLPDARRVRTIGLSQLIGEEPEEWY